MCNRSDLYLDASWKMGRYGGIFRQRLGENLQLIRGVWQRLVPTLDLILPKIFFCKFRFIHSQYLIGCINYE